TDPSTPTITTLSLHDALPIYDRVFDRRSVAERHVPGKLLFPPDQNGQCVPNVRGKRGGVMQEHLIEEHRRPATMNDGRSFLADRSEEHTSELHSRFDLVCRLL